MFPPMPGGKVLRVASLEVCIVNYSSNKAFVSQVFSYPNQYYFLRIGRHLSLTKDFGGRNVGCGGNLSGTWEETTMKAYATKILVLICVIGLIGSAPLHAQVAGATLTGTITDAQGGVLANAKVNAKNAATGIISETTTNSTGNYNLVNLKPAEYEVSVSATGFNTSTTKVTLTVGSQQELSLSLRVGDTATLVEVTGAAPVIET